MNHLIQFFLVIQSNRLPNQTELRTGFMDRELILSLNQFRLLRNANTYFRLTMSRALLLLHAFLNATEINGI